MQILISENDELILKTIEHKLVKECEIRHRDSCRTAKSV